MEQDASRRSWPPKPMIRIAAQPQPPAILFAVQESSATSPLIIFFSRHASGPHIETYIANQRWLPSSISDSCETQDALSSQRNAVHHLAKAVPAPVPAGPPAVTEVFQPGK